MAMTEMPRRSENILNIKLLKRRKHVKQILKDSFKLLQKNLQEGKYLLFLCLLHLETEVIYAEEANDLWDQWSVFGRFVVMDRKGKKRQGRNVG